MTSKALLRILFVNDYYFSTTGSSIANQNLCKVLTSKGIDLAIITSGNQTCLTSDRIHLLPTLVSRYPSRLSAPLLDKIWKIIGSECPDIIHIQTPLSLASMAVHWVARRKGIPVIAGIHDLPRNVAIYSPIAQELVCKFIEKIMTYFLNKADEAIAPSEYAKSFYRSLGVQTRIHVVSNGVDLATYAPRERGYSNFESKYLSEVNPDKPRVLFLGRVMPDKDLEVMVAALKDVDAVPVIVGRSWQGYQKQLEILGGGKAIFTGHIPSTMVASAYNACDVFIQPSTTELQSLALLEAMACGMPIIGVNHGPIPELVADGINGILFEPGNATDLKQKAEKLLKNSSLIKDMAAASVRAASAHSLDRTGDKHIAIYTALAARKTR